MLVVQILRFLALSLLGHNHFLAKEYYAALLLLVNFPFVNLIFQGINPRLGRSVGNIIPVCFDFYFIYMNSVVKLAEIRSIYIVMNSVFICFIK